MFKTSPLLCRALFLGVVVLSGGCSIFHKKPGIEKVQVPESPDLNRLVRPIGATEKPTSDKQMRAVEEVNAIYYYLVGQRLSSFGLSNDAVVAYERVRSFDAESAHLHYLLGQEYLKKGLMKEGVALVQKSLELEPNNRDSKLLLANLYATSKKYTEAAQLFEELQKQDPDDEEVMLYLALMEIEQKDLPKAEKRLKDFLGRNPESALAHFYLGRLQQERGQNAEALASYKRAIDIRPGFVQAGTYMGFLQEETGDTGGARQTYTWLANQTDDGAFHKKLGQLQLDAGNYAEALKAFENFERVDPSDLNNKVKIGLIYLELKDPQKARARFESVLKQSADSDNVRFYLGAAYEQMGAEKTAAEHYSKIPRASKLYLESLRRRLFLLGKQKRLDDGAKLLAAEMRLADKPGEGLSPEALFELGAAFYESAEDYARAEKYLNEGLERFPQSEKLLYLRGSILEKAGRVEEAVASMQKILARSPENAAALNFIGFVWADRGRDLPQAERLIRQALKLKPKDPFIMDSLGWVLHKRGHDEDARKILEEAFKLRSDESVIADHLGDVLVKLGRFEEARGFYESALKLGPSKESDKKNLEAKIASLQNLLRNSCDSPQTARGEARLPNCARSATSPGADRPADAHNRLLEPRQPAATQGQ